MTTDVMTNVNGTTIRNNRITIYVPTTLQHKDSGDNRVATPEKNEAVLTDRFDDPTYYG